MPRRRKTTGLWSFETTTVRNGDIPRLQQKGTRLKEALPLLLQTRNVPLVVGELDNLVALACELRIDVPGVLGS